MAGIAAMVLTGILGTAMGLNNTAAFMSSCVAFVAVSMWTDSRISRRRLEKARRQVHEATFAADAAEDRSEPGLPVEAERPDREGRST